MRRAVAILLISCGGGPTPSPPDGGNAPDAGEPSWRIRFTADTDLLLPSPDSGCLVPTGARLDSGTEASVLAMNARFALLDDTGHAVAMAAASELTHPLDLPAPRR